MANRSLLPVLTNDGRSRSFAGALRTSKFDNGGTPTPETFAGERIGEHLGEARQKSVNGASEIAGPFAVNDPDMQNAPLLALCQISWDEVLDLLGLKSVKIEHAVDRELDWFLAAVGSRFFSHVNLGAVWAFKKGKAWVRDAKARRTPSLTWGEVPRTGWAVRGSVIHRN